MAQTPVKVLIVVVCLCVPFVARSEQSPHIPTEATRYRDLGLEAENAGDLPEAIEAYSKSLSCKPDSRVYFVRASVWLKLNENEKALADCNAAIEIDKKYSGAYLVRGEALGNLGHTEQAIEDFTTAIELGPEHPLLYYLRGCENLELEKYSRAVSDFSRAIDLEPNAGMTYFMRGTAYSGMNDHRAAIADFTKLVDSAPQSPGAAAALVGRGKEFVTLGRMDEAIEDFSEALTMKPRSVEVLMLRAIAYAEREQHELAIDDLSQAIELEPNDAMLYSLRAVCALDLALYQQVLRDVERAIALNPEDAEPFAIRGDCRIAMGDSNLAISDYETAIKLDSNSKDELLKLAEILSEASEVQDLARAEELTKAACDLEQLSEWEPVLLLASIQALRGDIRTANINQERALAFVPKQDRQLALKRINVLKNTMANPDQKVHERKKGRNDLLKKSF